MTQTFFPDINRVYYMTQHCLFLIISGSGGMQVDFENYYGWTNKAIFLEKGQYIKFLSDDFKVKKMEFPKSEVLDSRSARVLFKHLVSLGHIDFANSKETKEMFDSMAHSEEIIETSSKEWFSHNPFKATEEEYEAIFDAKEIIDTEYDRNLRLTDLESLIANDHYNVRDLIHEKIGLTIKKLWERKRWTESRKEVALTDKSIQEVSYTMGFKDPGYFNRVFKQKAGVTPKEFRQHFDYENRDSFAQDILGLIKRYHKQHHQLSFYAGKMNLSVKTLQRKTRVKLGDSFGKLIRQELINSSKRILVQEASVKETAFALGFEEANHFTSFFKRYTGKSPSSFKSEIYN